MFLITTLFPLRLFVENPLFDFLDILNQILWGILFGSASRVNWDNSTVIEMVQDIESVSQRDWFMSYLEFASLKLSRYNYFWLVYSAGLKPRKELA